MPEPTPLNALPPGEQPRLTLATDRPNVRVRIVSARGEHHANGVAHGWTDQVVYMHWIDREGYRHIDYFDAGDVQRG